MEATVDRITVVQGDTVTLSCTATGIPTPMIDWLVQNAYLIYVYICGVMILSNVTVNSTK